MCLLFFFFFLGQAEYFTCSKSANACCIISQQITDKFLVSDKEIIPE